MADLVALALGFGPIPLGAILLFAFRDWIAAHRAFAWGGLAGVLAFLGLSHAMALVLETKSFLFGGSGGIAVVVFLGTGLGLGSALAWFVFEGPWVRGEPSKIVWAAAMFLAIHSFGDGLVLGRGFAGGVAPLVPIDAVTIASTVVHRFLEGAIVVVPALASTWRVRSSFIALSASIATIPAAYAPILLVEAMGFIAGSATTTAVSAFLAAIEAAFVLVLLLRGFLPSASAARDARWTLWIAVGFIGISLVHFLVE